MCERIALPGGGFAIVCGGHARRRRRCRHCSAPATVECDTCNAPLCAHCRTHVPPNRDYCQAHRSDAREAAAAFRTARP